MENRQTLVVVTPPAGLPLTVAEAKAWNRITTGHEDDVATLAVAQAVEAVAQTFRRAILNRTLELRLDAWPCSRAIELPMPPLVSVTSVKYLDPDGVEQTLAGSKYSADTSERRKGRVVLKEDETWPEIACEPAAVKVRYVAGYGTDATNVPAGMLRAIREAFALIFETRGQVEPARLQRTIRDCAPWLVVHEYA